MSAGAAARFPRAAAGAALLYLVFVLVAFGPVASGARSFFHLDLYYEHLPVWAATQRALLSGESPFWLDGEYCGHPALFHQEAPLFYPPTAPLLLTGAPVHRLSDLFTLGHLWLAGAAAFLLVNELSGSLPAALFGGLAWMLSSRMVQSAIWPNAVAVSALVPLGLWGLARIAKGRRRSGILVAAAAGGLALDAARPHVLLAAAPFAIGLAAALVVRAANRRRAALDFGLATLLALALGAPSLLPSAALLPETSRSGGRSLGYGGDPQPLARGRGLDMVFLPVEQPGRWPETAAYPGVLTYALFLSGLVLLATRREGMPRIELWACVAGGAAGLAFAFGASGPYRYFARLPILRGFRVPERFLLSWSLALAIGASLALAAWLARARRPAVVGAACLVLLAADLVPHALRTAPTADPAIYRAVPEVAGALASRLGRDAAGFPRRFLSLATPLDFSRFPDADRLRLVREAGALKGAVGMRFGLEAVGGAGPALERIEETVLKPTRRAFALAGAGAVVLSGEGSAGAPDAFVRPRIEPTEGLPRAFLVPEAVVVAPELAVAAVSSPALDPRRTAVLEDGEPLAATPVWSDAGASVRLSSRSPSRVVLETRAPAPSVLVLLDAYESGWRARLDGAEAPVLRADGAFRAVRLPAGAHRVEFLHAPPGLREGLLLGAAGLLGFVLVGLKVRPRRENAAPEDRTERSEGRAPGKNPSAI